MNILIPKYEYEGRPDPDVSVEAAAWPTLVQIDPIGGTGRVALQTWLASAAYKPNAGTIGKGEEFSPGNGLPTLAEMTADPAFVVAWTVVGNYLLTEAAKRWPGATVELTETEAAIMAGFGQFLASL